MSEEMKKAKGKDPKTEEKNEEPLEEKLKAEFDEKPKEDVEKLKSEIEKLKAELKEKDDRYLRMAAEYDNFRKRSSAEKDAVYDNALSDTVKKLLPMIDNLERAVAFDDGEKVKEGLQMTLKTTATVLSDLRVEAFGAVGETFNPALHNAVMHEENPEKGEGEIVDVFQKGYKKGDKVIRFAMVKTVN